MEKMTHRKSGKVFTAEPTIGTEGYFTLTGEDGKSKQIAEKTLKKGYRKWQEGDGGEALVVKESATGTTSHDTIAPPPPEAPTTTKETSGVMYWLHETGTLFVTYDGEADTMETANSAPLTAKEYNELMAIAEEEGMTTPNSVLDEVPNTTTYWKHETNGDIFAMDWAPSPEETAGYVEISQAEYDGANTFEPAPQPSTPTMPKIPTPPQSPRFYYWDDELKKYWNIEQVSVSLPEFAESIARSQEVSHAVWTVGIDNGQIPPHLIGEDGALKGADEPIYLYHKGEQAYWVVPAEDLENPEYANSRSESLVVKKSVYEMAMGNKMPTHVPSVIPPVPTDVPAPPVAPPTPPEAPSATKDTGEPTANSMRANREAKKVEARPFVPERPYLRQSMIKTYELDPGMFYKNYEENFQENTIFTSTGTSVHGVMEDFFTLVKEGKVYPDPNHAGEATIEWKGKPYNVKQFTQNRLEEWWAKFGWANLEWYKLFLDYTEAYLAQTIIKGLPEVIAVELEFTLESDKLGTPVTGTIDRVDRVNETTIRIVDYKTNFMAFSTEELNESQQFMMYTLALRELKDVVGEFETCICQYDMIRLGISQSVIFDDDDLEDFKSYMKVLWAKMLAGEERDFKPNKFTVFSSIRDNNPAYNDLLHNRIITEYKAGDMDGLVEELELAKATEKTGKIRKEELNLALKSHISEADGLLVHDGYQYKMSSSQTKSYDSAEVVKTLAMFGNAGLIPELAQFKDKALRENVPAPLYNQLVEKANITYASPQVSRSKVKAPKAPKTKK